MPDAQLEFNVSSGVPVFNFRVETNQRELEFDTLETGTPVFDFQLATPPNPKLISVDDVKTRLSIANDGDDAILEQLVEGYTALLSGEINREFFREERTEYFNCQDTILLLMAPPVVSVEVVGWQELKGGMTPEIDEIDDIYYFVDKENGEIHIHDNLPREYDSRLVVTYTGGFPIDHRGVLNFNTEQKLGATLRQACIDLVSVAYQRRRTLGVTSISRAALSENLEIETELKSVKRLQMDFYRYT